MKFKNRLHQNHMTNFNQTWCNASLHEGNIRFYTQGTTYVFRISQKGDNEFFPLNVTV